MIFHTQVMNENPVFIIDEFVRTELNALCSVIDGNMHIYTRTHMYT